MEGGELGMLSLRTWVYSPSPSCDAHFALGNVANLLFNTSGPLGLRTRFLQRPDTPARQHQQALSLPPMSSPGVVRSPDVVGTKEEQRKIKRDKSVSKRLETIKAQKEKEPNETVDKAKLAMNALEHLCEIGLPFGDLVEHVFDPANKLTSIQWDEFF